ncbi:hypothetical protein [Staphylococcus simulans]|uniref:Phage protein n=1 Tax=Staphylococcus simulans UMC-CNS-990 TaxID=1405498 RepID=A0ABP2YTX8_STASI|nr:hypothetical protein [Staphylococcus simulans]ERS92960.1 hypothetical protein SSIM_09595 [Staphylococcus simulans UMC-CNS-990]MCE5149777.1 hypothetical protein [Staphylococcus simulans]PTJ32984.1 hypothetical protein BU026_07025 [Staphylococcus simulans]
MKKSKFEILEEYANQFYDGHYTIMKFTTNYRVAFGTLYSTDYEELRNDISKMAEGKTLELACENCIVNKVEL